MLITCPFWLTSIKVYQFPMKVEEPWWTDSIYSVYLPNCMMSAFTVRWCDQIKRKLIATHKTAPLFLCGPFKLATHSLLLSTLTWCPCSSCMLVFQAACKLVIRSMVCNSGRFNGNVTFDEIDFLRWSIARYNLNYIQDISNKSRMSQVSKYFSFVVGRDPFERWVFEYSGQTMLS